MPWNVSRFGPETCTLALNHEHWTHVSWESRSPSGVSTWNIVNKSLATCTPAFVSLSDNGVALRKLSSVSIPGRGREKRGEFCGPFPSDNLSVRGPCHKRILVPIPPARVPSIDNLEASNQNKDGKL